MKARNVALAGVGDAQVMHPKLVHRGYGMKAETQASMSHAEQVHRLLAHIRVLEGELAKRPNDTRRKARYVGAVAKLTMHLELLPKDLTLRG